MRDLLRFGASLMVGGMVVTLENTLRAQAFALACTVTLAESVQTTRKR